MAKFILFLTTLLTGFLLNAQNVTGDWHGNLNIHGTQLPLVFHISEIENGLEATMDSPSQGAFDIPVDTVSFKSGNLMLKIPSAMIFYEGKLEGNIITGTFKQGMMSLPLNLTKEKQEKVLNRPQEPKEPFPYQSEKVFFQNEKAGIKLAGTLTLPSETGKFPVVVLISGSGPQNRNEEILGHKPFLVLADYLTRNGIAVLRFDDRGVAQSEGDFASATTTDFATDVEAALNFLKTKKQIDQANIGLIGHSEGGLIAPMLAANSKDVDFLVLLAAPGVPIKDLMLSQKAAVERASGANEIQIAMARKPMEEVYNIIVASEAGSELTAAVTEKLNKSFAGAMSEAQIEQLGKQITSPWWVEFLKSKPANYLQKVEIPVLAMNGGKDLQVPSKENLAAIKAAVEKAGNKNVTIKEFENLNHLFQESETGLPSEYGQIEQTFSTEAFEFMTQWILEQVN